MKKFVLFLLCFCASFAVRSQDEPPSMDSLAYQNWAVMVSWFLPLDNVTPTERAAYTQNLQAHCRKLQLERKQKNEQQFLAYIFRKTHKQFLTAYTHNSHFSQVFQTGKFDCVASTTLFALILEHLGYTYQIHETPLHVYLKVQTAQGEFLLETTHAGKGFLSLPADIQAMEQSYLTMLPKNVPPDFVPFNHTITLKQLAGLQFYNQALAALQTENIAQGNALLRKAKMLYNDSERVLRLKYLVGKL